MVRLFRKWYHFFVYQSFPRVGSAVSRSRMRLRRTREFSKSFFHLHLSLYLERLQLFLVQANLHLSFTEPSLAVRGTNQVKDRWRLFCLCACKEHPRTTYIHGLSAWRWRWRIFFDLAIWPDMILWKKVYLWIDSTFPLFRWSPFIQRDCERWNLFGGSTQIPPRFHPSIAIASQKGKVESGWNLGGV